jgi:hypothetical protein
MEFGWSSGIADPLLPDYLYGNTASVAKFRLPAKKILGPTQATLTDVHQFFDGGRNSQRWTECDQPT